MKRWRTTVNVNLLRDQFSSSSSQSSARRQCSQYSVARFSVSESAVNQNASINENSKSSNSRSLRQHTLAKSISLCCFCFCLVLRNRSFRHTNMRISFASIQQDSHFDCFRIYLLSSHFFFFFVFTSLRLSHLLWNFQLQSWSVTHLRFNQWISSQCRSIEEMNSRFETKLEEEKRIVLRACLKISIEILSYQRKFIWRLVWTWHTFLLLTFDLHVHICSLNQIFSLCYLFSRHASYNLKLESNSNQILTFWFET